MRVFFKFILHIISLLFHASYSRSKDFCTKLIENNSIISISKGYNRAYPPPDESPVLVYVGFIVNDVLEVDDNSFTIKLKIQMPLYWNDSRIALNKNFSTSSIEFGRWYYLDSTYMNILWFPNIFVSNLQEFKTITSFGKSEKVMTASMPSSMRFYYVGHHLISFTCPMQFDYFPFDTHICLFEVYLKNPIDEIQLLFFGGNASEWGWSNISTILKYSAELYPLPKERTLREERFINNFTIKQSVAGFTIKFQRKSGVYIFDYYIPSGIFVVVSWVSLVIPPDAPPGRIALIITTFLVLVNIANSVFSKSPRSHSINPIQVWILSCITFVFITVIEYAAVLFLIRKQNKFVMDSQKKKKINGKNVNESGSESRPKITAASDEIALGVLTTNIDHACAWLLIFLFLIFNIAYWSYYSA